MNLTLKSGETDTRKVPDILAAAEALERQPNLQAETEFSVLTLFSVMCSPNITDEDVVLLSCRLMDAPLPADLDSFSEVLSSGYLARIKNFTKIKIALNFMAKERLPVLQQAVWMTLNQPISETSTAQLRSSIRGLVFLTLCRKLDPELSTMIDCGQPR